MLIENLRARDLEDYKTFAQDPLEALEHAVATSAVTWSALEEGRVICMWGIKQQSLMTGAHLWLVGSEMLKNKPYKFLVESRRTVKKCLTLFQFLYGYVDDSFVESKKWMEWLGFKLAAKTTMNEMVLCRYELRAK